MKSPVLLQSILRMSPTQRQALAKLGITTARDLLYYFPVRYGALGNFEMIANAPLRESVVIYGKLSKLETKKSFRSNIPMATAVVTDTRGDTLSIIWMRQPYMAKMFHDGDLVQLSGIITESSSKQVMMNPQIEKVPVLPIDTHRSLFDSGSKESIGYPVYPETKGISSTWIYHALQKIIHQRVHEQLPDRIPESLRTRYKLPSLATALVWIHAPEKKSHAQAARKRFAFEEIFLIQLKKQYERALVQHHDAYTLNIDQTDIDDFMKRFSFQPTDSQSEALSAILKDLQKNRPMSRLIEGDVGSGKTFVASVASYAVIKNRPAKQTFGNLQVAYMAPTEVLATQLFENFVQYFNHTGISIGLITGSGCRKYPTKILSAQTPWTTISKPQLLKWVANGEIPIVIGTHALIQKNIAFKHLGMVIVDEQHRFGTGQRMKLAQKQSSHREVIPHYLSMTATPIPRTLALTMYGDLDVSVIDQMPSGRKPVITRVVHETAEDRNDAYQAIKEQLAQGRQVYVICPRIDDPDEEQERALNLKSVTSEAKRLKEKIFPEYRIDIMHSKMTPAKKEQVMKAFMHHDIDILVSTSVVEVGVSVPNATVIIIEGSERFGLAQLHQLRGRVIRGTHQAYCYLFANAKSKKTRDRLRAFLKAKNGFELAELDLAQRGGGDLLGIKQWGISDLAMEALKNIKMVEYARTEAQALIAEDPLLEQHPLLQEYVTASDQVIHFE